MFINYNTLVRFYFKQNNSPALFKNLNEIMLLFNVYFGLLLGRLAAGTCRGLQFADICSSSSITDFDMYNEKIPHLKINVTGSHSGEDPNIHSLSMFWVPLAWPHLTGLSGRFALWELPSNSSACPWTARTYFTPSGRKASTRNQVTPSTAHHRIAPHLCYKGI